MGAIYLPLAPGTKKPPLVVGWTADPPPPMHIAPDHNRGKRLDDDVDVDADCPEALCAARKFLPETGRQHGRPSVGVTHWWFKSEGASYETFTDVVKVLNDEGKLEYPMLIEIRTGKGHYTVVPPSRVPVTKNGSVLEMLRWFADGEPRTYKFEDLRSAVVHIAITALLVRHFVPDGERWKFYEALAGFLLGNLKLPADVVCKILDTVADIIKDTDTSPRPAEWVKRTDARLKKGQDCIGATTVAKMIGEHGPAVVTAIRKWCGVVSDDDALILSPADPMPSAEAFVVQSYTVDNLRTLHHQSELFYAYQPDAGAYQHRDEPAVRADLYKFLQPAQQRIAATKTTPTGLAPFQPTLSKVANVLDALRAVCNLPTSQMPPCWLHREYGDLDPRDMLAFTNGLLHVPMRKLYMPTPHFFTLNGLDFAYDPWATQPTAWLAFLRQLWPTDESSVEMLQEMFGYLLTPDTSFQKGFMLHGPRRSGKGIIGRIARRLVGERNACSPTLASFGETFGKQVLIGKTLAVISDARISGRTDTAKVAETLLSVSGEDAQTVPRKFLEDWSGPLYVRFLILTNELPHINDASGALASRFLLLALTESFYGKEDRGLFNKLAPELPSIALWALEGRDRLYQRGYFVQPESANQLMQELEDLSSPVSVFLRTHTTREVGKSVTKKELFEQWSFWCNVHGIQHAGTDATFGRNVRAVLPGVQDRRVGERGKQERCWVGVWLSNPVTEEGKTDM